MEIDWGLLLAVVVTNTVYCLSLYWSNLQEVELCLLPGWGTLVPGTKQKFNHWQDYSTYTWGDLLGLVWPQVAFAHLCVDGFVTPTQVVYMISVAVVAIQVFHWIWMGKSHLADFTYPALGKISATGCWHLPYFGANVAIGVNGAYHCFFSGHLRGELMWLFIVGECVWIAANRRDAAKGRFGPPKYES